MMRLSSRSAFSVARPRVASSTDCWRSRSTWNVVRNVTNARIPTARSTAGRSTKLVSRSRSRDMRSRLSLSGPSRADAVRVGYDSVGRDVVGELSGDVHDGVALDLGEGQAVRRVEKLDGPQKTARQHGWSDDDASGSAEGLIPLDRAPLRAVDDQSRSPSHRFRQQGLVFGVASKQERARVGSLGVRDEELAVIDVVEMDKAHLARQPFHDLCQAKVAGFDRIPEE